MNYLIAPSSVLLLFHILPFQSLIRLLVFSWSHTSVLLLYSKPLKCNDQLLSTSGCSTWKRWKVSYEKMEAVKGSCLPNRTSEQVEEPRYLSKMLCRLFSAL